MKEIKQEKRVHISAEKVSASKTHSSHYRLERQPVPVIWLALPPIVTLVNVRYTEFHFSLKNPTWSVTKTSVCETTHSVCRQQVWHSGTSLEGAAQRKGTSWDLKQLLCIRDHARPKELRSVEERYNKKATHPDGDALLVGSGGKFDDEFWAWKRGAIKVWLDLFRAASASGASPARSSASLRGRNRHTTRIVSSLGTSAPSGRTGCNSVPDMAFKRRQRRQWYHRLTTSTQNSWLRMADTGDADGGTRIHTQNGLLCSLGRTLNLYPGKCGSGSWVVLSSRVVPREFLPCLLYLSPLPAAESVPSRCEISDYPIYS